ncbi:MAG: Phosphotransferase enzyme family [Candidatus Paceibacter sp.]|nr:Phosphotransferase enzyme family [Candidatus Paceibacter sp.]
MESILEKLNPMIHFKNQPKLSGFEVDRKRDEQRLSLIPHIESFLGSDELYAGKEVTVEFSHGGVSSLLCFVEADGEKRVLKIPLSNGAPEGSEALFLKQWESVGVATPHVFREGRIGDRPFILMSFVDAPLLTDVFKDYGDDVSIEEGKTLHLMHTAKAQGFGRIREGKPDFGSFKDWALSEDMQGRYKEVQELGLLTDEHGSLQKVLDTLIEYSNTQEGSNYCHFDFGSNNLLATRPLTVIDPDPTLNHAVLDLGRSITLASSGGSLNPCEDLKEGYFSGDVPFEERVLQSAVILNAYMKFPYWHKKDKTEAINNVRQYLAQTRGTLER